MAKSKSKTFPKHTDYRDILKWIDQQVECSNEKNAPFLAEMELPIAYKYLITITKYPEKKTEGLNS